MNAERAVKLYDAITAVREDYLEDALPGEKPRHRIPWRGLAALAACLCLILGIGIYQAFFSGGTGFVQRKHTPGEPYQCYTGPILPLTAGEAHDTLTLSRELTLDLSPFPGDGSCLATDRYTLKNTGDTSETLTLLYPFAEPLRPFYAFNDPPSLGRDRIPVLTVNGETVSPELTVGKLINPGESWPSYLGLMQEGSFTLSDVSGVLAQRVTVYELRDCWSEDPEAPNPTLCLDFTADPEKTALFTWRFNGGSFDRETGARTLIRSLARPEQPEEPAYLVVLGQDISSLRLQAYMDGGCETITDKAGGTVLRRESTLGEMLALCWADMCRTWGATETSLAAEALTPGDMAAVFADYPPFTICAQGSCGTAGDAMLEDILQAYSTARRILVLRFTVTVPAGESLEIAAVQRKEASYDYGAGQSSPVGFDALSARAGKLRTEGETVTVSLPEGVVCAGQNLAPEGDDYRYWVDVQRRSAK